MGEITTIGLDLAKHVFQVHGVDAEGSAVLRKQLRRGQPGDRAAPTATEPGRGGGASKQDSAHRLTSCRTASDAINASLKVSPSSPHLAEVSRGERLTDSRVLTVAILRNHQGIFARTQATKNALKELGRMKSGGAKEKGPAATNVGAVVSDLVYTTNLAGYWDVSSNRAKLVNADGLRTFGLA